MHRQNNFNNRLHTQNFITTAFQMQFEPNNLENPSLELPQRTKFKFSQNRQPSITFDSQFDSGNMNKVVKNSYDHYSLWTACDAQGSDNEGYPKSWFYFRVGGFANRKVHFSVHRVHFLYSMKNRNQLYRPVYRVKYQNTEISDWDRLPYPINSLGLNNQQQLVLKFDYFFPKIVELVQFAFIYPYSYEQCRKDVLRMKKQLEFDEDCFFGQYELTRTYQKRIVDMIMISSHQGKEGFEVIAKNMPFGDQKITKFRNNKPIILISARVHPIQTPSSFCMKGIMQFLTDKKDMRAHLLRKYFVFVLIPMLNPDGVSNGHCRMDALNQNLNRYYNNPDPEKQPSCFAVRKLSEHFNKDKRLFMYLDLHAHPAFKGNFTFGNAIYEFIEQVQSQLFAKTLSTNCINFQFQQCIFSRKHMKAKDRNEDFSKEGCGRVVFYKEFGLIHAYTLECGYHMNTFDNKLEEQKNVDKKFIVKYKINERGEKIYEQAEKIFDGEKYNKMIDQKVNFDVFEYTPSELDSQENQYYKRQVPCYTQATFQNLGRNILITILDIWNKNPYSRGNDINAFRKQIAEKQSKLDRFRKEQAGIKTKQKKIVQLIEEQFYEQWHRRNIFNPSLSQPNANTRDYKKRNHTLQFQKTQTKAGQPKSQKMQKAIKTIEKKQQIKTVCNIDAIESDTSLTQKMNCKMTYSEKTQGQGLNGEVSEKSIQRKIDQKDFKGLKQYKDSNNQKAYYSRNNKISRGIINNIANQYKEKQASKNLVLSGVNKELVGTQIKITLEQQIMKYQRHDGLSLSSKLIKSNCFNPVRVRNVGNANTSLAKK